MSKIYKIKIISQWGTSEQVCNVFNRMSKGDMKWNNIEITSDDKNIDYYCVINYPRNDEHYEPLKTIYMTMEPIIHINSGYFPKEWRHTNLDKSKFLHVLDRNNIEWHLSKTYSQLMLDDIKKTKLISSVTTDLYMDPGHRKRIHFLQFLENMNFTFDLYGKSNRFKFKNYKGSLPQNSKDDGIFPYRYTIACENSQEKNYFTEKIVDAILGECLCFYWGCPNISDFIDEKAYVVLDLDDWDKSYKIIIDALSNDEWSKRIEVIRKEKQKILNELQFFPTLEKIVNSFQKEPNVTITIKEVVEEKPPNKIIVTACNEPFMDSCLTLIASIHRTSIDEVDAIYVYNLGLSEKSSEKLNKLEKVTVKRFEDIQEKYPKMKIEDFYNEPRQFSYKSICRDNIPNGSSAFWIDCGAVLLKSTKEIFDLIEKDDIFIIRDINQKNYTWTHPKCIEIMNATKEEVADYQICGGIFGYKKGGKYQKLMNEALEFQYNKECNNGLHSFCYGNNIVNGQLIEGHRQDQSIYAILASRYNCPVQDLYKYGEWRSIKHCNKDTVIFVHRRRYNNHDGLLLKTIKKRDKSNGTVVCKYKGRFGNQLFIYFAARIFAEKNKLNLKSTIDQNWLNIKENIKFFQKPTELQTIIVDESSYNDSNNTIKYSGKGNYIFDGFFQYEKYFYENKQLLLSFIDLNIKNKNIATMHVRLDDYLSNVRHVVISINYYIDCIKRFCKEYKNIYIICDKLRFKWERIYMDKLISKIKELNKNVIYEIRTMNEDLNLMATSDIIITSNSTFCFWAAFLSKASSIIQYPYFGYDLLRNGTIKKWDEKTNVFKIKSENTIVNDTFSNNIYDYFEGNYLFDYA